MITIRPVAAADLDACYEIALKTGDSGKDATALHSDPKLIGHLYVAPYVVLEPHLAMVAVDDQGIAGYLVGVTDTLAFQARLARDWWPALQAQYAPPAGEGAPWTAADAGYIRQIHHPEQLPPDVVAHYPAHMHMNLLPRLRRQGVGTRLMQAWRGAAGEAGRKTHVGVSRTNPVGRAFWESQGFRELTYPSLAGSGALWMGADW